MTIDDPVYGKAKISEPVILELLENPALLRLKKISQYGIPDEYFYYKGFSRFDHSVGVMLFLRKIGASLEEQVAGLLHDVSTTAFSHVADWVFKREKEEDYHELIRTEFIENTEIPKILKKHRHNVGKMLDEENFPLLEKMIPDLCADRIDYALRELTIARNEKDLNSILNSFQVKNREIVFGDSENARKFADNFLELQLTNWGSEKTAGLWYLLAEILIKALKLGIIEENDFLTTDEAVLGKIKLHKNKEPFSDLERLKEKGTFKNQAGRRVVKKFRYVDPKINIGDSVKRLSEIDQDFQEKIGFHQALSLQGFII